MLVNHSIVEQLNVYTYGTREAMGAAAAEDAARRISRIIEINGAANISLPRRLLRMIFFGRY